MQGYRKRKKQSNGRVLLVVGLLFLLIVLSVVFWAIRYAPSKEMLGLSEFYQIKGNEAVLFINDEKIDRKEYAPAIVKDGEYYLQVNTLKNRIDRGYVYDSTENILRYATENSVINVNLGDDFYTVGRNSEKMPHKILQSDGDAVYVSLDFVRKQTDIQVLKAKKPNRLLVYKAGYKRSVAKITKNTEIRRFGGPKSKILKEASEDETVDIIESYGSWTKVLTKDGVMGCIKSKALDPAKNVKVKSVLPKRTYQHIKMDEKVNLLWHQVTNKTANASIGNVLAKVKGINVISPTWFTLSDNKGGLTDVASLDYVRTCHNAGIQVWGLVSNLSQVNVDTASVLNVTSARDNLVNNLIGKAIAYDLDGINIDLEAIPKSAEDGYTQFIRELSIKCENNDLVLSVDNYSPTASSAHYNRDIQADYADYCIVMAYDEHYAGSEEAGSNASISFVKEAVEKTLKEVPADQVILGMPFYSRIWKSGKDGMKTETVSMLNNQKVLNDHKAEANWDEGVGQNYAEFTENDILWQFWLEDSKSLALKLNVMRDNQLAGGAFWKEGQESQDVWDVIETYMK